MRHVLFLPLLLAALSSSAAAQPTVLGLQNNYGYLLAGTPNYAFAQGGIFIIYGSGMAPDGLLTQGFSPALDPNLGGVTVRITVNGVTTTAIPYYVSPGQIAAILPSATPVGMGSITVTFNGATSAAYPIQVVQSAFGMLTMSGNGLGQAVVQDANYVYHLPANAAAEDEVVIFWGTGLGPDPNEETQLIAAPQSLDALPFELYIGHKPAEVLYHGRSQFPGLDQIVARIPRGMTGCFVSVYVKTGDFISNFTTIPVGLDGVCGDTFATVADVEFLSSLSTIRSAELQLGRFNSYSPGGSANGVGFPPSTTVRDNATAQFFHYTPFNYVNYGALSEPSFGSCTVNSFLSSDPFTPPFIEALDAGALTLTLPDGQVRNMTQFEAAYSLTGGPDVGPPFIPEPGRTVTFTATGGTQVGPFVALATVSPAFVWNEQTTIADIPRDQPLTLTWSGGDPDGYVLVLGTSLDPASVYTTLVCTERAGAGRIVIPRDVMASMIASPVNTGLPFPAGQLLVYNYQLPQKFTAEGIDNGNVVYFSLSDTQVDYR